MHHCVGRWLKINWTKALYQQTAEALFPTTSRCRSSPQKVEKCRGRLEKAKDAVMPSIPAGQAETWNRKHAQTNRHCSPQAGSLKQAIQSRAEAAALPPWPQLVALAVDPCPACAVNRTVAIHTKYDIHTRTASPCGLCPGAPVPWHFGQQAQQKSFNVPSTPGHWQ
jgi:hypothetical protein